MRPRVRPRLWLRKPQYLRAKLYIINHSNCSKFFIILVYQKFYFACFITLHHSFDSLFYFGFQEKHRRASSIQHPAWSVVFFVHRFPWVPNSSFWCVPQKSANLPSAVARSCRTLKNVGIRKAMKGLWSDLVGTTAAVDVLHHLQLQCATWHHMQATRERKDVYSCRFDVVWLDQARLHQYPKGYCCQ